MPIRIENLSYTYSPKTPYEKRALKEITFSVGEGETVGIVGATGSGKSTLIQHLNGIIKLKEGKIVVGDIDLSAKKVNLTALRRKIGMLFQYPEYQLFEDTVLKDVMFGCKNFGYKNDAAEEAALNALRAVGLDPEEMKTRSPFELSGGQKRRAAIAGVIAYEPEILILDEPTGGLDPQGKKEMLDLIRDLKKSFVKTVIMISHNMDEIAEYSDRVIVLENGALLADTTPEELFSSREIARIGLGLPHTANILLELRDRGVEIGTYVKEAELTEALIARYGNRNPQIREPKTGETEQNSIKAFSSDVDFTGLETAGEDHPNG